MYQISLTPHQQGEYCYLPARCSPILPPCHQFSHHLLPSLSLFSPFHPLPLPSSPPFLSTIPDKQSWWMQLQSFPSLLLFHSHVQLTPSLAMEFSCALGALLALTMMIFRAMRCTLTFLILWALYLSVYKVGTPQPLILRGRHASTSLFER